MRERKRRAQLDGELIQRLTPLRDALHRTRNEVLPVVGSGLSSPHLASWKSMLAALIDGAPEEDRAELHAELERGKYLEVASHVATAPGGRARIARSIKERYQRPAVDRPAIYELLLRFPVDHFLTTNWDPWLEEALHARDKKQPRVLVPSDGGAFSDLGPASAPFVLKLHGDAAKPEHCVLRVEEFRELQSLLPGYLQTFSSFCSQRRLLFVGHSLSDPDLDEVLSDWGAWLGESAANRHFLLVAGLTSMQRSRAERLKIDAIEYAPAGEYEALSDVLAWLAQPPDAIAAQPAPKGKARSKASRKQRATLADPSFERALASYRFAATSAHETVSLMGFGGKLRAPIRLDELHVPLHAHIDPTGAMAEKRAGKELEGEFERYADRHVPLIDAFGAAQRHGKRRGVVLLGDPGSGKTTHLKRVLLSVMRAGPRSLALPEGIEPILLPLRDLEPQDATLLDFATRFLRSQFPTLAADFAERLLRKGRVLFLLDGLDEIADEQRRARVSAWISDECLKYPEARFLVTCRRAGYTPSVVLSESFLELQLRPMDPATSEAFIRNWFRAVEAAVDPDAARAAVEASRKAEPLIELLRERDYRATKLVELLRNPLLLTAVCLVQYQRGDLPRGRAQLYKACVDILLESWHGSKRRGHQVVPGLDSDRSRELMQEVAHWMHQESGRTQAKESELVQVVASPLARASKGNVSALDFLHRIRDDSGLLTGFSGDLYGFLHLGFQEYLAARRIRALAFDDKSVLAELALRFGDSWWQEVILLLLAEGDPPLFLPFFDALLEQETFVEHAELIDLCLAEAFDPSAEPFRKLLAIHPHRAERARSLCADIVKRLSISAPEVATEPKSAAASRADARGTPRLRPRDHFEIVAIAGGSFRMGSPKGVGWGDERPQHRVKLRPFELSIHAVTNEQYGIYLSQRAGAREPEHWADRSLNQARQPIVGISWSEARDFCAWAGGDLPTEAQWEYACRAGTTTRWSCGDHERELARVAWIGEGPSGRPHPVGEKEPNAWGLFDMHGNVWEWCLDWFGEYSSRPQSDPTGPAGGSDRVLRGGSYWPGADLCRSASRYRWHPDSRPEHVGFRVAFPAASELEH